MAAMLVASETLIETGVNGKIVFEFVADEELTGSDFGATGSPATCGIRFFVNQGSIPSIILGPGSLHQAHTVDEYI